MSGAQTNGKSGGNIPSGLPLLYKLPSALDSRRHAQASISKLVDYSFAKQTNSLPINLAEFGQAMRHYPIVFSNDKEPVPVVIVGMEQNNYFIKPDNSWQDGAYIPAYVRQYPFIFFERPEEKKLYLCVDEAAPQFSATKTDNSKALYTADGKPTALTNNAMKFCTAFYQHHIITRNFCADLKEHKLLQPYQSEITLSSGKKTKLSGFQMIDEKALNALPDKIFLEFRKKGWLAFIYFSLASTSNWKNLAELEAKFTA
ncbi:MAG: SapC family protein [Pseudomonadota bacterium]